MSSSAVPDSDWRLRRVLLEALDLIAEPDEAREIVADALRMARREQVPTLAQGLRAFVEGHLADAVEARLGVEAADRFAEQSDIVLRVANAAYESGPAPQRGHRGRLVLVASSDPQRVVAIAHALAHHADVEPVEREALSSMVWANIASVVVIDWARSPLDVAAVDEVVDGLGEGRVVLWGAPREIQWRFVDARRSAWLSCAPSTEPANVAKLVLRMLAQG